MDSRQCSCISISLSYYDGLVIFSFTMLRTLILEDIYIYLPLPPFPSLSECVALVVVFIR
jgi:hypothetical protein